MKRRTDRVIAISAVTTVAVVPTAILMVVKVGGGSPDGGAMPPNAAMAQQDPANPNGSTSGTLSPGASGASRSGSGTGPAGGSGAPGTRPGVGANGLPTAPPQPGPSLSAFTRNTDMKVTIGSDGDYKHATETATFTLWPQFAMSATGVTHTMKDGALSKVTEKVIVSGRTLKGYDGEKWTQSTLTAAQLKTLQTGSDPRQFTFMIGTLPGVTASEPDANGATRFTAQALMGGVYALLPKETAAQIRKWIPDETGCALNLWADTKARPTQIALTAKTPATTLTGTMTFTSYQ